MRRISRIYDILFHYLELFIFGFLKTIQNVFYNVIFSYTLESTNSKGKKSLPQGHSSDPAG